MRKMGMMDKMMEFMNDRMSKEEKQKMMDKMMGKMFADMSAEDKKKMMEAMMPKMMEGVNMMEMMPKMMMGMMGGKDGSGMMGMVSEMMESGKDVEMPMMRQMMVEMMPQRLRMVLPSIPKEKRLDFVLKMVATLMEQGCIGMSEEEKREFVAKVVEKVKT